MKNFKTTFPALTLFIALVLSFASCKKDSNNGPDGGASGYKYNGTTYAVSNANEKHIQGDIFLELSSTNPGDYLQISFANVGALPKGTLTFNADRNNGYNPQKNFWATSLGLAGANISVNGGTITVSKDGDKTKIVFDINTANGKITGEYNGTTTVTN